MQFFAPFSRWLDSCVPAFCGWGACGAVNLKTGAFPLSRKKNTLGVWPDVTEHERMKEERREERREKKNMTDRFQERKTERPYEEEERDEGKDEDDDKARVFCSLERPASLFRRDICANREGESATAERTLAAGEDAKKRAKRS